MDSTLAILPVECFKWNTAQDNITVKRNASEEPIAISAEEILDKGINRGQALGVPLVYVPFADSEVYDIT